MYSWFYCWIIFKLTFATVLVSSSDYYYLCYVNMFFQVRVSELGIINMVIDFQTNTVQLQRSKDTILYSVAVKR